jgi:hypothetical protein
MTTNPNFNPFGCLVEQDLYEKNMEELIQSFGFDVTYLPRNLDNVHTVFRDNNIASFTTTYTIEMFLENQDGFGGEGEFMSKFGLEIRDTIDLLVMVDRFTTETGMDAPEEGDLIYFPFNKGLYEIKFVERDPQQLFALGKRFMYRVQVESFEYSQQRFDTGVADIDAVQYEHAYQINLNTTGAVGTFTVGEQAYEGPNLAGAIARGKVAGWDGTVLELVDVIGTFTDGATITGDGSGATASFDLGTDTYEDLEIEHPNDPISDSDIFESEGDSIIDFTENNPFSEEDF